MDPKDDLIYKHQSDKLDRDLQDKYRALNTWADIGAMRETDPDEDRLNMIAGRLAVAETMLENAFKDKGSYDEVVYYLTNKVLKIEPRNARALTMRAIAHSQISEFIEALSDAKAALSAEPDDDSPMGKWMRARLPAWILGAEKLGL